jgi:MFS family permease
MNAGLDRYGFRTILRAWATAVLTLSLPLLYLLRPRLPISSTSQSPRLDFTFLRTPTFWLLQTGNILEGLGYFIPSVYLPLFARSLGLSPSTGTVLISLINTSSVLSAIIVGLLIDRFHVTSVILLSTIGSVTAIFLFWGFSSSLPLLCIFASAYGLFAGGFSSTYTGIIKEIKRREESADVGLVIGLLSAGRGIGAVVSGPLSEVLLQSRPWQSTTGLGYGSAYEGLIVFTGVTAAAGGVSFLGRVLGWM